MARDRILMSNMTFYGHHGVEESERRLGGRFAMDVELYLDLTAAGETDDLTKTVDYKAVYDLAREIETSRNYLPLEALAHDTALAILARFPVEEVVVRARKQSVPLGGVIDFTEVQIQRCRGDQAG